MGSGLHVISGRGGKSQDTKEVPIPEEYYYPSTSLKNSDVFCRDESLPEAIEQFVVKLCHHLLLPHTKHREAVAIPCPPFFSFFFSHFGASDGRED